MKPDREPLAWAAFGVVAVLACWLIFWRLLLWGAGLAAGHPIDL